MRYSGLIFVFSVLALISWGGTRIYHEIQFDRHVSGYLKRAADANTVELAKENLEIAVKNVESHGMTDGYTSILYRTPDEDVGFWYRNLRASLTELQNMRPDTVPLERSNMLMKLRETLLDQGETSVQITAPPGISVFPNNTLFAVWCTLSIVFTALSFFGFFIPQD